MRRWTNFRQVWSPTRAMIWAVAGALSLAIAQALGPAGWTIWVVPAAILVIAVRGHRTEQIAGWLLLVGGAVLPLWLSDWPFAILAQTTFGMALDLGLMVAVTGWLARRHNAFVLVIGMACFRAVLELLWARSPLGDMFAWGAYRLEAVAFVQIANLAGLSVLSFLIVFLSAACGVLASDLERRGALRTMSAGLALLALTLGLGVDRISRGSSEHLRVAAVAAQAGDLRALFEQTREAADEGAQVVVWPLASLRVTPLNRQELFDQVISLARENAIYLIVGVLENPPDEHRIVLIRPTGEARIPAEQKPIAGLPGAARAAPAKVAWLSRFGGVAALLPADLFDPARARVASAAGATVLGVPSSQSRDRTRRVEMLARARALENALIVLLPSSTGSSVIISPYGQPVTRTSLADEPQPSYTLVADVAVDRDGVLLATSRRRFPWLALLGFLIVACLRRTHRPPEPEPWDEPQRAQRRFIK